ncbi:MAG: hypothetical protein O7E57_11270, partial [Gammaproteobacteria bacterium]|nr:hypothetical protein [Gammaproteobacteria bacterium]
MFRLGDTSIIRAFSVAILLASPSVSAQTYQFDISTQVADKALTHLAQHAGVAVLYLYDEVHSVTTNEVVGTYTVEAALNRMLAGTVLEGEVNNQGVLTARLRQSPLPLPEEGEPSMSTNEKRGFWNRVTVALGLVAVTTGIPVQAQERSASAQALLEEIVVTARRREENLLTLPLSIQAFTAEAME